ncbi:MAG: hypothetical protein ACT4PU_03740 [Planctomycetota bacterium]
MKALTLSELMEVTSDVVHVTILDKSSFKMDYPYDGAVYTRLSVSGTSLRTGEPVSTQLVFLGSHEPRDQFGTSEMPTLQDTRIGSEAVAFYFADKEMPGQLNRIFDFSGIYRVEKAFGKPVVVGKGEGLAFAENVKLEDVRTQVRKTHLELLAAKAKAQK